MRRRSKNWPRMGHRFSPMKKPETFDCRFGLGVWFGFRVSGFGFARLHGLGDLEGTAVVALEEFVGGFGVVAGEAFGALVDRQVGAEGNLAGGGVEAVLGEVV